MSITVQKQLLKLALVVDKATKDGQRFQDSSSAVSITATANNGSGLIRITAANHNFQTENKVYIIGIVGTTEANNTASNPYWVVTRISSSTFDLVGSAFSNAWSSGGTATGALIGSVDGSRFPRQRMLDIYNFSRFALMKALSSLFSDDEFSIEMGNNLISKTDLQFASGVASKPSGYIKFESLYNSSLNKIGVLNIKYLETLNDNLSASTPIVIEFGNSFKCYNWTSAIIPDALTYILNYYGNSDFTLSDVLGGTVTETFNDKYCPMLIELAQAIAEEQSSMQINSLAIKLLGGQ